MNKINLNSLKQSAEAFKTHVDYDTMEDESDDKYWWCFKGNKKFDRDNNNLPYDPYTVELAIEHLNKKIISGDLPVFAIPAQIIEVYGLLERQDFDYMEISAIIERNPSLTGMFISSINSSMYNRGFTITELYPALLRLGKKQHPRTAAALFHQNQFCR